MGDTAQQAKHAATYRFCTKSSQYAAVEPLLKADERWTAVNGTGYRLLLADRWDVPYARLGVDEGLPGCKPLVNHMRGTKHITVKGLMVTKPSLAALPAAPTAAPRRHTEQHKGFWRWHAPPCRPHNVNKTKINS
jgi:hypothetical protein